jgi:hypothetical protein
MLGHLLDLVQVLVPVQMQVQAQALVPDQVQVPEVCKAAIEAD